MLQTHEAGVGSLEEWARCHPSNLRLPVRESDHLWPRTGPREDNLTGCKYWFLTHLPPDLPMHPIIERSQWSQVLIEHFYVRCRHRSILNLTLPIRHQISHEYMGESTNYRPLPFFDLTRQRKSAKLTGHKEQEVNKYERPVECIAG